MTEAGEKSTLSAWSDAVACDDLSNGHGLRGHRLTIALGEPAGEEPQVSQVVGDGVFELVGHLQVGGELIKVSVSKMPQGLPVLVITGPSYQARDRRLFRFAEAE